MIDDKALDKIVKGLREAIETDKVNKVALTTIHQLTAARIFRDGIKANGTLIGLYTKNTLKIRRAKNYPSSKKIILQATGRMVNDYKFLIVGKGKYGSGFNQSRNFELSNDLERRFGTIWELTKSENDKISIAYDDAIRQIL